MMYGLKEEESAWLIKLFKTIDNLEQVILFGSRATGTHRPTSDVDIALVGNALTDKDLNRLDRLIDSLLFPYKFDILLFHEINNPRLSDAIKSSGIVIYNRDNAVTEDKTRHIPRLYLVPSAMSDAPVTDVIPQRNIEIVRNIKHFVVENIRSARRFLKRCDRSINIDELSFTVLDEHTAAADVPPMLAPMEQGHSIAVISEAGCPAIADPGADLVAAAQSRGYEVVPLVGPSSILLALMGSGFNGQTFAFNGYLPIDAGARTAKFKEMERRISRERQTQIFIETPYRNNRLIAELTRALPGSIKLCVASDITGPAQSIITRPLSAWKNAKYNYDKIPTIFLIFN